MTVSIATAFGLTRPRTIIGVKIATIGNGALEAASTVTDGRYRLASYVPEWDTSDLYRNVLMAYPYEVEVNVDWQTGVATTSGQELKLKPTAEVCGWLLRPNFRRSTLLSVALDDTDTTVVLDAALADGTTIMIGREAIVLGTGTTTTTTSYAGCRRAALSTQAYPHGISATSDVEVFLAGASPVYDLLVELFTAPTTGGSYSDETTIWRGVLRRPTWDGETGLVNVSSDSIEDILARTLLCTDLFKLRAYGNPESNGYFNPDSTPDSDTTAYSLGFKYPTLLWDGERSFVSDLIQPDTGGTLYFIGGNPDCNPRALGGAPLPDRDPETLRLGEFGQELTQLYTTNPGAPAFNAAGDRLSTNAVILAMQLLTTTSHGFNGTYDLGLGNLGAGIPSVMFDYLEITPFADEVEGYAELTTLYFPLDGKPFPALDFVQNKILRPFGLALVPSSVGKYSIRRLRDGAEEATAITQADVVGKPSLSTGAVPAVDRITVTWGQRPGIGTNTDTDQDGYNTERAFLGQNTTLELDAEGVGDKGLVTQLGLDWTVRYHFALPRITITCKRSVDLWPGDVVELTHAVIPGRNGARGLTSEVMVVSGRRLDLSAGTITYELWWTSAQYNRVGRIGPSARVTAYSDPNATVTANAFKLAGGDPSSDGKVWQALVALAGTVPVLILDSDLHVRGSADVVSASTTNLELSGATVAPVANDVIVLADAATVGAEELARYAFLADASDLVDGTDAYEWTR